MDGSRPGKERDASGGTDTEPEASHWVRTLGLGLLGAGLVVLGLAVAVAASMASKAREPAYSTLHLSETAALYGGHSYLCLEVASTPESRAKGLSGRREIGPYDGMVFLFPGEGSSSAYWMKDTHFPLDIVFVRVDGRVSEVQTMTPCEGEDCPLYWPKAPYLFAVELAAGHAEQFGLAPGEEVRLGGGCLPIDRD